MPPLTETEDLASGLDAYGDTEPSSDAEGSGDTGAVVSGGETGAIGSKERGYVGQEETGYVVSTSADAYAAD